MLSTCPTSKRIVLCIDDDEGVLRYLKALLERSGYVVLTAVSTRQGLNLVTMCNCDVVLLDYDMPEMDGDEVAFEIKRIRREIIVILFSGCEVPTCALSCVDAYVHKFEASRQLLPMIAELCGQAHAQAELKRSRQQNRRNPLALPPPQALLLPLPRKPI
jgi:CheY-like chemotaxis protein